HLVGIAWETKGVESIDDDISQLENVALQVAKKYDTIAVVTGEIDVVCEGENIKTNRTGHVLLTKVTGAGCLLGSVIAACLTSNTSKLDAAHEAVAFYGRAAEIAAEISDVNGSGTFLTHFVDALGM